MQQAHHLALTGRVPEALAAAKQILRSAREEFPVEASVLEAECSWWCSCLGRYEDGVEMGVHALTGMRRRESARRTWALASAHVAYALLALGRWDQAESRLRAGGSSAVIGTRGAVLDVLSGIVAVYRDDQATASADLTSARAHLPLNTDRVWPPIRAWLGWLDAELATAKDDIEGVR